MDWARKFKNCLDSDLSMHELLHSVHEDTFDYVHTVGSSIENQLLTVSSNIENQFQTIAANIKQICSGFIQDTVPIGSLDLSNRENPKLADEDNKDIKVSALESSVLGVEVFPEKGLEQSLTKFDDSATYKTELSSDDSFPAISTDTSASSEPISKLDSSCAEFEGKVVARNEGNVSAEDSDDTADEMGDDTFSRMSTNSRIDELDVNELDLDECCNLVDSNELCCLCLRKRSNSQYNEKRVCEKCVSKMTSTDQREREPLPSISKDFNTELSLSEDISLAACLQNLEGADYDFCDSDWEVI